ncbi:actin-like ATPase domain-containing protein [Glonium stellatum]|uniref:Actin-like ATPase domain-containing protein n=1 Tax=Glonium stellatum TaxID=574774 RepID=A0A8E2F3S9_9PEZI|nr:actin-like ATPase domain-containing protein [Glonium stellatum]
MNAALGGDNPDTFEAEERVVIALDFGTTFSGIAYCFPNQHNSKVATVVNWPGIDGESHNAPKIPTLINYNGKNFAWGAAVNPIADNIVGVKLLLDPSQEKPLYLPTSNIKNDLKKLPKAPVMVAADFIGAIYRHALQEISAQVPRSYMDLCQKQFVLSVPAVWSDAAKNSTLQAAKIAGLFPVTMIKEPEAAALHTLHDLGFTLHVGDAFIICDAGGGTVDLISYEVEATSPRLKLKELVPGSGGMAGSLGLNKRFEEAVKNLVGEEEFFRIKKAKAWFRAATQFDREIKPAFRGKSSEEYFVNFPMADFDDDPANGLDSNCWRMTGDDVKDIFAPLITDILRLINEQANEVKIKRPDRGVTGIFLVGGFGSSQYLKACVERAQPGIQVLQPSDAWSAIAKGAALSKLPDTALVESTKATKHYGVEAYSIYDEILDYGENTTTRRDGTIRVLTFTWYIGIGDDLCRDQVIKFPFYRSLDSDFAPDDLIFQDVLYESKDKTSPRHKSKGDAIKLNCTVKADLRGVDRSQFRQKRDIYGKTYIDVQYDLVVKLESALMTFSCEVNGKTLGSVEAKYRY